jgi:arylsulfatase A-like enzyme
MKNLILLTIDTLRKDVLGCYGNKDGLTPFIDSLQDKCIKFTNAQSTGPYTQASFPGILTSSCYLEYGRQKKCSPKRTLISEVLKKSGITTAAFHSNPYLCGYFGWNRGWDIFYDSMQDEVGDKIPYIKGDGINDKVDQWLSSYIKNDKYRPFFLWTHYMDVHEPYIPTKEYLNKVDPSINFSENEMLDLFKNIILKRDVSDKETVKLLKKLYDAGVCETDNYVKEFFSILEKYNVSKDTTIIITTDHGDEFGEHGGLSHDGKMYSELISSPLLIYRYNRTQGEVCDNLVSNIDISPTILHLFGLEPFEKFRGHSVLPLKNYHQNGVFGEAIGKTSNHEKETDKPIYFYQEDDLKIIYRENDQSWEMYNLLEDPEEVNNIIEYSSEIEKMKSKLKPQINRWTK